MKPTSKCSSTLAMSHDNVSVRPNFDCPCTINQFRSSIKDNLMEDNMRCNTWNSFVVLAKRCLICSWLQEVCANNINPSLLEATLCCHGGSKIYFRTGVNRIGPKGRWNNINRSRCTIPLQKRNQLSVAWPKCKSLSGMRGDPKTRGIMQIRFRWDEGYKDCQYKCIGNGGLNISLWDKISTNIGGANMGANISIRNTCSSVRTSNVGLRRHGKLWKKSSASWRSK